jgi:N-acetylglucosaminyl-diphospho-decaprenol L-rhamnosyltransferase
MTESMSAAQQTQASLPMLLQPAREFDVEVGVIYTNERELMPPLLSSLRRSADGVRMRLILLDNNSSDGAQRWADAIPHTLILPSSERLFYAANLNRILAASTARYVLLLNTDMFFDPRQQCLARMVAFMNAQPDCGVAGCRLYHADGRDAWAARRFQTLPVILARRFGLGRLLRRTLDRYLYREHSPADTFDCDWLSGCFLMMRRAAVEQVGLFDESFGKYFEDVDICWRTARAGWRVMYHGGTSCYHLEQRASRKLLSADAWKHLRSYLYWLQKRGRAPAAPDQPAAPAQPRRAAA